MKMTNKTTKVGKRKGKFLIVLTILPLKKVNIWYFYVEFSLSSG